MAYAKTVKTGVAVMDIPIPGRGPTLLDVKATFGGEDEASAKLEYLAFMATRPEMESRGGRPALAAEADAKSKMAALKFAWESGMKPIPCVAEWEEAWSDGFEIPQDEAEEMMSAEAER